MGDWQSSKPGGRGFEPRADAGGDETLRVPFWHFGYFSTRRTRPANLFFCPIGFSPPCVLVGVGRPGTGAGAPKTQHVVFWPPATRTAAPVWGGETEMARWPTNIPPFYLDGPIWAAKNFTAFWPPKHFCTQVGPDFGGP